VRVAAPGGKGPDWITDGPGSVWSAGFPDLPTVRSCRRLTGMDGAPRGLVPSIAATAVIPLIRDRGNVVERPGPRRGRA
jgi:hypothetical protein